MLASRSQYYQKLCLTLSDLLNICLINCCGCFFSSQGHHRLHPNVHVGQKAGDDYQVDRDLGRARKDADHHSSKVLPEALHRSHGHLFHSGSEEQTKLNPRFFLSAHLNLYADTI